MVTSDLKANDHDPSISTNKLSYVNVPSADEIGVELNYSASYYCSHTVVTPEDA
jgi:hypothetical protein